MKLNAWNRWPWSFSKRLLLSIDPYTLVSDLLVIFTPKFIDQSVNGCAHILRRVDHLAAFREVDYVIAFAGLQISRYLYVNIQLTRLNKIQEHF